MHLRHAARGAAAGEVGDGKAGEIGRPGDGGGRRRAGAGDMGVQGDLRRAPAVVGVGGGDAVVAAVVGVVEVVGLVGFGGGECTVRWRSGGGHRIGKNEEDKKGLLLF